MYGTYFYTQKSIIFKLCEYMFAKAGTCLSVHSKRPKSKTAKEKFLELYLNILQYMR